MMKEIEAKRLSDAQYALMYQLQRNGKVRCTDRNRKTYKKLMEYDLVNYDSSYDYVVLTERGKKLEL